MMYSASRHTFNLELYTGNEFGNVVFSFFVFVLVSGFFKVADFYCDEW
jgi:hypothetical protein